MSISPLQFTKNLRPTQPAQNESSFSFGRLWSVLGVLLTISLSVFLRTFIGDENHQGTISGSKGTRLANSPGKFFPPDRETIEERERQEETQRLIKAGVLKPQKPVDWRIKDFPAKDTSPEGLQFKLEGIDEE